MNRLFGKKIAKNGAVLLPAAEHACGRVVRRENADGASARKENADGSVRRVGAAGNFTNGERAGGNFMRGGKRGVRAPSERAVCGGVHSGALPRRAGVAGTDRGICRDGRFSACAR